MGPKRHLIAADAGRRHLNSSSVPRSEAFSGSPGSITQHQGQGLGLVYQGLGLLNPQSPKEGRERALGIQEASVGRGQLRQGLKTMKNAMKGIFIFLCRNKKMIIMVLYYHMKML